jgi:hypothetical protein
VPLVGGPAKEEVMVLHCHDALLHRERQDYLKAIREALAGVEAARVALAKAKQRLEGLRPVWNHEATCGRED